MKLYVEFAGSYMGVMYCNLSREGGDNDNEGNDEDMNFDDDEAVAQALSAADALGKSSKSSKLEPDSLTDALKELDMDNYDEEDDGMFSIVTILTLFDRNFASL